MENKKQKILIVEDEKPMSMALREKFAREGFDVHVESNGKNALPKSKELRPDIILLDVLLPGMDGLAMLKELREDEWGAKVPVIILSNISDDERLKESLDLHAENYLIKSNWTINDVVDQVRQCLENNGTESREEI